jgi:hypothetical protein
MLTQKPSLRYCLLLVIILGIVLNGCTAPAIATPSPLVGSCSLHLEPTVTDQQTIQAVLAAEGNLVVKQQIDDLMRLWAEGSTVTDAKNTPNDTADDQSWLDKDAIRNRYVRIVFPGAPKEAVPSDLKIQVENEHATVIATTHIGNEISPAGDRWTLVKQSDCWLIESLTYNLESNKN